MLRTCRYPQITSPEAQKSLPLKFIITIVILVLMLTAAVMMFSILLASYFNDWEVHLLTNLFGEGPLELFLFFIATFGGAVILTIYIKRIVNRKKVDGEL